MKQLLILCFLITVTTYAQKELWGVNNDIYVPLSGEVYYGNITKYDINGQNPIKIHEFNSVDGKNSNCKLFLASNGKIYGTTLEVVTNVPNVTYSVFFEYDPILNKYRTISNFAPYIFYLAKSGLIEPIPGKLYGCFGAVIFNYDLNTEAITISTNGTGGGDTTIAGELIKASNGDLYGTTIALGCASIAQTGYRIGGIFKYSIATNSIQMLYSFKCDFDDGAIIKTTLLEGQPNKLYGVAYGGGVIDGVISDIGTLFEYNTLTNVFTKKITFDGDNLGKNPTDLTMGTNGKLYGVCQNGGTNVFTNPNNGITYTTHNGTLFEYTPATNTIIKLHDFGPSVTNGVYSDSGSHPLSLTKTSNGYYMGTSEYNPFKFDASNNTVVNTINGNIPFNTNRLLNFIEICRKPSYQEFLPDIYSPQVGTSFTFDVNNDNAATFVWKKGITVLPSQTTGVLTIPNITLADSGIYTCTMTNECGVTVTMPLTINVTNLATETINGYTKLIALYPNPTKGILHLKFPENRGLKGLRYKISNVLGQTIVDKNINNQVINSEIIIDSSAFTTGVYQISFETDRGTWYGKFIKE